jgi:hypothetical protein
LPRLRDNEINEAEKAGSGNLPAPAFSTLIETLVAAATDEREETNVITLE